MFSSLAGLGFVFLQTASAKAPARAEDDLKRRRLIAFQQCLSNDHIDEEDGGGNPAEDFNDMWDGGGDHYTKELIVVGFDIDSGNGVQSCKTVVREGFKILDASINTDGEASDALILALTGGSKFPASVDKAQFQKNRDNLVSLIGGKLDEIGRDPRRGYTAARLTGLVQTCYTIKTNDSSVALDDHDFRQTLRGQTYIFDFNNNLDDDDLAYLNQGSFEKVHLGDITLGFDSDQVPGVGAGRFDAFISDFYPFGSDLQDFTSGHAGNNGILDCEFAHDKVSGGFFTDDVVASVDVDNNIINTFVDYDGDGQPGEGEAIESVQPASNDPANPEDSCESGGGELSWILCPMLRMGDRVVSFLDNQIEAFLQVPNSYFENENGDRLRLTWARLRNIAYIILVPVVLILVLGTALGFEFISAYTVKRALPRLIIAIMFIAVSFDASVFMIRFINDIGSGMMGLLTSSFNGGDITLASLFNADNIATEAVATAGIAGGTALAIFSTAAIVSTGGIGILISYALVMAVVLLFVFLIFALRQMMLVTLALLAPLAIISWIFPGNDKLWKLWWGTFSKLLFLYPVVVILIASGRIFASVVRDAGGGSFINTILVLTAYIVPYFLIPAALKSAGGLFATITGMVNDKGRGFFDRNKKYRAEKYGQSYAKVKRGDVFGGSGRASRLAQGLTRPDSFIRGKYGEKGRSALSTASSGAMGAAAKTLQENGLLDDEAGNEFIQNYTRVRDHVKDLRAQGKHELANKVAQYAQFEGQRSAMLGAAKLNAQFGKLSDGALKAVGASFGSSAPEQGALQSVFGDLIFTSKGAGNYATYAARLKGGQVMTMSDAEYAETEGRSNMAKALMDAGPNVLSSIKPYTDKTSGGEGYSTKDLTARAVADGVFAAKDGFEAQRAIEGLAMGVSKGAYNDPKMKAALDRSLEEVRRRSAPGGDLAEAFIPTEVTEQIRDAAGKVTGTRKVIKNMNVSDYFDHVSSQIRGGDPRFRGIIDE